MTTHYNLHIISVETDLKITYKDGVFKKLEHLKGIFDEAMLKAIGKAIPKHEKDMETFQENFKQYFVYKPFDETKIVSIFSQFNSSWFAFFRKQNNNLDPKFTGTDGTALKQIIAYLKSINNGDEDAALASWNLLLDNWNSLSEFHQKQTDLKYINSKLNVIIREIIRNNGTSANGSVSI